MRIQRHKMGADDFEPLTMIGKGAFGEKTTGNVYAMKKLKKSDGRSAIPKHTQQEQLLHRQQNRRLLAYSTLGTPDYIAPEVSFAEERIWNGV
ncbi:putative non-specific serine/threonine protein kinase [Helianthus annuus]|nr:putative non-specific serine/threonine protein kinase [Helianthus annuus]